MGLSIIFFSNILLVQVNSSNTELAFKTFIRQIKDKVMWSVVIGTLTGLFIMIYSPLSGFFKLAPLTFQQLLLSVGLACVAVLWYELVKVGKKMKRRG
jgi:Ca2+-transporting ATPase